MTEEPEKITIEFVNEDPICPKCERVLFFEPQFDTYHVDEISDTIKVRCNNQECDFRMEINVWDWS